MKKYFSLLLVLAMCLAACDGKKSDEFVDLGLPSGTKWKAVNEEGFYDYDEAVNKYGASLPSKEQLEELKGCCVWEWNGKGYVVKGDNGNSIVLQAAGYRGCNGDVRRVGTRGYYWSSTPYDSDYALHFYFGSIGVDMYGVNRCHGLSVRLVQ